MVRYVVELLDVNTRTDVERNKQRLDPGKGRGPLAPQQLLPLHIHLPLAPLLQYVAAVNEGMDKIAEADIRILAGQVGRCSLKWGMGSHRRTAQAGEWRYQSKRHLRPDALVQGPLLSSSVYVLLALYPLHLQHSRRPRRCS